MRDLWRYDEFRCGANVGSCPELNRPQHRNDPCPHFPINVLSFALPGQFPIAIQYHFWGADYPYPSDLVDSMYKQGGIFVENDWTVQQLNSTGHADQAAMFAQMNSLINIADSTTNTTLAAQDYKAAEQLAINLYMYVYLSVGNGFIVVKPYMNGYQGQISYQENPMLPYMYFWWVKTCGSVQACSGRNIGP